MLLAAYESILPLSAAARSLRLCTTAAGRLDELTLSPPAVADPVSARALTGSGGLSAEGVCFRYEARQPWVLDDAELRIAPREHVALLGPSGAGKSTIAELLVRFRDPLSGHVCIDGIDMRELTQRQIRDAVVLCAQDCHVFNTTIRENLLLACRDASERQIVRALAAVQLDDWAAGLPDGLDTLVGQDGELISGGQRTRIALARALLADCRFLILDEPTAHLDADLALRVMQSVLSLCADRGLLVITHDAALLEGFDSVLRVQHGRIEPCSAGARTPALV
jgi:ABC-type transport system involved in cytochrome bd biosynthesis fused ATPase/permease subunit